MRFTPTMVFFAAFGLSHACHFNVHSSTVGDFTAAHSEPKDHGGAAQTISGGKGACSFSGSLHDGCSITGLKSSGCGSLSFTVVPDKS